jgi:hypothetical protein
MNTRWILVGVAVLLPMLALTAMLHGLALAQGPGDEVGAQEALGTGFTYQGRLVQNGVPVSATCDFDFGLWDAASSGSQVDATQTIASQAVISGFFTTSPLDFGSGAFNGEARWLAIRVNCGSGWADLGRQPLTPAPYALYAASTGALQGRAVTTTAPAAGQALKWDGGAWVPAADADTTYNAGFGLSLTGTQFGVITSTIQQRVSGDCAADNAIRAINADGTVVCQATAGGMGDITAVYPGDGLTGGGPSGDVTLTVVFAGSGVLTSAARSDHDHDAAYWSLTGNGGTSPGANFLGTTDAVSLTLAVSGTPALRLEPNGTSPNLIVGSGGNSVGAGVVGAAIGGGGSSSSPNQVGGDYGVVGGGRGNQASGTEATIGGGWSNQASGYAATVAGGEQNRAVTGTDTTVGGGWNNQASGNYATVGGGAANQAIIGTHTTVGGGWNNQASGNYAAVGGGWNNQASGYEATVCGGELNQASGAAATIGGGQQNRAIIGTHTTVAGGWNNQAGADYATVGGGRDNQASSYSFVGGGEQNQASGVAASVCGGGGNRASSGYSFVGGGLLNQASGQYATVGGGYANTASGQYATVPGGAFNTAAGGYSFAAGQQAKANQAGCFVWGDSADAEVACDVTDAFIVRASGGVTMYTNGGLTAGATLPAGGGSWSSLSDRALKANLAAVDGHDVLARLMRVPVSTWNYTSQDPSIRHMGPMAQDFYAAFGLGEDEHITTVDADGVALAAIQGLYAHVQQLEAENAALKSQTAAQQAQIDDLQKRMAALEAALGGGGR